jgi:hypothetical protein
MLCDVISAVAEFMVRVFHLRSALWIRDVVGVELRTYVRVMQWNIAPVAMLLPCAAMTRVATLKVVELDGTMSQQTVDKIMEQPLTSLLEVSTLSCPNNNGVVAAAKQVYVAGVR